LSRQEKNSGIATLIRDNEEPDAANAFEKIVAGEKLQLRDVESLMGTNDLHLLGLFADRIREKAVGRTVTYVSNIILNYTNRCIVRCRFCAFYRDVGSSEGYSLTVDQVADRVTKAWERLGVRQALIQGGVNPEYGVEYFEELFRTIKKRTNRQVAINGLSTSEVEYLAKKEGMSLKELLSRLREAGLDSLPGAGAEILVDRVRRSVGRGLSTAEGWLRTMEEAHKLGIPTSATMVYGLGETAEERSKHLLLIRDLQERTGGFISFTPWNFEQGNTRLEREGVITARPSGAEHLKITALARIVFGGNLRNIQSSWLTNGVSLAQLSLCFGANDWGGTLYDEEVIPATGKDVGNLAPRIIVESVRQIGRPIAERDNSYNIVRYVG
jgi:cyclic dehypoxanthinyl futalosine synthase